MPLKTAKNPVESGCGTCLHSGYTFQHQGDAVFITVGEQLLRGGSVGQRQISVRVAGVWPVRIIIPGGQTPGKLGRFRVVRIAG